MSIACVCGVCCEINTASASACLYTLFIKRWYDEDVFFFFKSCLPACCVRAYPLHDLNTWKNLQLAILSPACMHYIWHRIIIVGCNLRAYFLFDARKTAALLMKRFEMATIKPDNYRSRNCFTIMRFHISIVDQRHAPTASKFNKKRTNSNCEQKRRPFVFG